VSFPDSVIDMMRGNLGQPPGGFPPGILKKVLKDEQPNTRTARQGRPPRRSRGQARRVAATLEVEVDDEDLMGYMMYPKVFTDYATRHKDYGPVRALPTRTFFYGMEPGRRDRGRDRPGVSLVIRLSAVGETNEEGEVRVFFELNGQPRTIRVPNRKIAAARPSAPRPRPATPTISARRCPVSWPRSREPGQKVAQGDLLLTIEAMKMETGIHAERDATVSRRCMSPRAGRSTPRICWSSSTTEIVARRPRRDIRTTLVNYEITTRFTQFAAQQMLALDFTGAGIGAWTGGVAADKGGSLGELLMVGPGATAELALRGAPGRQPGGVHLRPDRW
jgi:biotin carboxyl carrier protein